MGNINIFASGDFCPVRGSAEIILNESNLKNIFGNLTKTILEADISITNLETPLTQFSNPLDKQGPNFKANPKIAKTLKDVGFNLITLANNHIFDQGQQGLKDTLESLENQNLKFLGAGLSLNDSQKPLYMSVKGIKMAFVNFAEVAFNCANENHGGASPMDIIDNTHQIKLARKNADIVIVIIHGGQAYHHYPSPETRKKYRFFAENGADVIIAHHPHCIQGYEIYEGVPIFYSLGNFLFPKEIDNEYWFEGYAVNLEIGKDKIDFQIIPYEQCKNNKISIKMKSKSSAIYRKIEKLSKGISDDELIESKFEEYLEDYWDTFYLGGMAGLKTDIVRPIIWTEKLGIPLSKILRKIIDKKISISDMRFIKMIMTCQSHRERAVKILKNHFDDW